MKIQIDTRESDETKDILLFFLECEEKMLEVGDIIYDDKIVFEHKTPSDFLASVFDGRLFRQIEEMNENYPYSFILISGTMTDILNAAENMSRYNSILAAICSCFRRNCPVIFCDTLVNMADVIKILGEKLTDGKVRSKPVTKTSLSDKRLQFICALDGISESKGKALLEHFSTVRNVLTASSDELQEVFMVGKSTAEKVRNILES